MKIHLKKVKNLSFSSDNIAPCQNFSCVHVCCIFKMKTCIYALGWRYLTRNVNPSNPSPAFRPARSFLARRPQAGFWEICNFPRAGLAAVGFYRIDSKGSHLRSSRRRASASSLRLVLLWRDEDYLTDFRWGPFQLKKVSKLSNV